MYAEHSTIRSRHPAFDYGDVSIAGTMRFPGVPFGRSSAASAASAIRAGCRQRHKCHAVCMDDGTPSEADYTTSTNPERFSEVIDFAKQLVTKLETEFVVERSDGEWSDDLPGFSEDWTGQLPIPVRMIPSTGVPLVFGFTSCPGVVVRVGRNVELRFPDCLCDACNLQVDEMCDELRFHVDAVTSGNFTEKVGRRKHQWAFEIDGRRHAVEYRPPRGDRKALGLSLIHI